MALSPEDMARMTLADIEALARRFSEAVALIKDAQALLGGAALPAPTRAAAAAPVAAQANISPEAQAELDAWRHSSARAKLLEQFKPESPVPEVANG